MFHHVLRFTSLVGHHKCNVFAFKHKYSVCSGFSSCTIGWLYSDIYFTICTNFITDVVVGNGIGANGKMCMTLVQMASTFPVNVTPL